jgi:hypothetical protein
MSRRLIGTFAALLASAALLTGCAIGGSSYSVLDRAPEASDALPTVLDSEDLGIDRDTARYVGERDGTRLWLARGEEDLGVCLVVFPEFGDWVAGCGGGDLALGANGQREAYLVRPDIAPAPRNAERISENVYYGER